MRRALCLLVLAALTAGAAFAAPPSEPEDYRMDVYLAETPATLAGAHVVDDAAAHALWYSGAVAFIDVLPRPPKPANLPEGTIWRDKPRWAIPGTVWLPNTGYGALAAETAAYFAAGLAHATGGDKTRPVLIYCRAECWMSWNAAKRALEIGYERVFWYPDGTDGWEFYDWPLERIEPFEGP